MQEDKEDTQRTDIFNLEEEEVEESAAKGSPVGKLIAHDIMGHEPPQEDTGQESSDRQEDLSGDEVEEVKERLSHELQTVVSPQRERTEHTDD